MVKTNLTKIEGPLVIEINLPKDDEENFKKRAVIPAKEIEAHNIDEQDPSEVGKINFKEGQIPSVLVDEESIEEEEGSFIGTEKPKDPSVYNPVKKKNENVDESKNKTHIEYDVFKMILERYQLKCLKGDLYLYSDNKGCFFELKDFEVRTLVRSGWSNKIESLLSKSRVDDIIDRLKSYSDIQITEDDLDPYPNLINFHDCVLDIETGKILKHSPNYCFTSFIDANYNKKRSRGENFMNFINQCTEGDKEKIDQIQQILGYTIGNYTNAKRWFAFIGEPHTGKSTILDLLTEIIGGDYTSNVPLHELSSRFSLADLFKKKLNVCGEINDGALKNINTLKALTGNDRVRADVKYKAAINFINKAKIIMAGNTMPQIQTLDNTTAFIDRILFVVFNNTIPEHKRDYKLKEKLIAEKDYIAQWAVEGLYRLISNNFIFPESSDSIGFKKQYQNEMSNINDFISVMCKLEPNNDECRVHKRDLYTAYINYGRDNCNNILSKKEFFNEIKKLPIKQSKFRYRKSTPLDGFTGISLKQLIQENEQ
jgi:putative DNA primase/helicase